MQLFGKGELMQSNIEMDQIIVAQWQGEGRNGMGFTVVALGRDGAIYRHDKGRDGFYKLNMRELPAPELNDREDTRNGKIVSNHIRR